MPGQQGDPTNRTQLWAWTAGYMQVFLHFCHPWDAWRGLSTYPQVFLPWGVKERGMRCSSWEANIWSGQTQHVLLQLEQSHLSVFTLALGSAKPRNIWLLYSCFSIQITKRKSQMATCCVFCRHFSTKLASPVSPTHTTLRSQVFNFISARTAAGKTN